MAISNLHFYWVMGTERNFSFHNLINYFKIKKKKSKKFKNKETKIYEVITGKRGLELLRYWGRVVQCDWRGKKIRIFVVTSFMESPLQCRYKHTTNIESRI